MQVLRISHSGDLGMSPRLRNFKVEMEILMGGGNLMRFRGRIREFPACLVISLARRRGRSPWWAQYLLDSRRSVSRPNR